ncbi:unnamed protein product [Pseudo-nitzschia multistriata]|uniref:Uncharacterized protein n=1 Tax=Pseudo-nitzschia multistriata TaxID=183589 RepID=A0A448ZN98_9STRA|nr:unnamed protein product [Pseudo-nitzschia multistriata]
METLLWFVSDSRESLHETILEKEQEYQKHQTKVLETAHEIMGESSDDGDESDDEENGQDSLRVTLEDPPKAPKRQTVTFEMKDVSDDDQSLDDSIKQEIREKETNRNAYFDTLDDILE